MAARSVTNQAAGGMRLRERRLSAKEQAASERALQRFVRLEYWNGFAAGDIVRVAGHAARGRHWRFRAHVTNTSNGASWVELALVEGSPPSRRPATGEPSDASTAAEPRVERIRAFDPDLVSARWSRLGGRRTRALSRSRVRRREEAVPAVPPDSAESAASAKFAKSAVADDRFDLEDAQP